jgi:hypothetical protein
MTTLLFHLLACATVGTLQTADPLGKGNYEVGVEPAAAIFGGGGTSIPLPAFDVALRAGVSERVDVSGSLGFSGLGVGTKILLTDPDSDLVYVSVAPSATVFALGVTMYQFELPVLVGVPFGEHQLVVAPKLYDYFGSTAAGEANANMVALGGSAGFSFRVGENVRVMPEYAVVVPVAGSAAAFGETTSDSIESGVTLSQLSLGIAVGF